MKKPKAYYGVFMVGGDGSLYGFGPDKKPALTIAVSEAQAINNVRYTYSGKMAMLDLEHDFIAKEVTSDEYKTLLRRLMFPDSVQVSKSAPEPEQLEFAMTF